MTTNNKPIETIRFGRIAVAIWKNSSEDGKTFTTFTAERTYTDPDGNVKSTTSFNRRDLLTLAEALRKAYTVSYEKTRQDAL